MSFLTLKGRRVLFIMLAVHLGLSFEHLLANDDANTPPSPTNQPLVNNHQTAPTEAVENAYDNFNSISSALNDNNITVFRKLTPYSPRRRVLEQLMGKYPIINSQIITITINKDNTEITGILRIISMQTSNGDKATPSRSFRDTRLYTTWLNGRWTGAYMK